MVDYTVTVATTDLATAGTFNNVHIKLVGTDGESEHTWLVSLKGPLSFMSGAFHYAGWMPNAPISLQRPPAITKGTTSEATMLETLPDINTTVHGMSTVWLLSRQSTDSVLLGQYPEELFSEKFPCKLIKHFQGELQVLSAIINARNENLEVPYTYLDPMVVENSVST